MQKTNAMRLLDAARIHYDILQYDDSCTDAELVAAAVGKPPQEVFKTLVTKGGSDIYVFVVPATGELDLKKAAALAGVKSISMLEQKYLLSATGYIHGGCSPVGMKKSYSTYIDNSAFEHGRICVSGGKRGLQICLSPTDLAEYINAGRGDLSRPRSDK